MPDIYLKVGDDKYPFNYKDLTVGRLRKIKEWYGPDMGRYLSFVGNLRLLDPDAAACAVWVARTVAGEANVPEPHQMPDFALAGFIEVPEEDSEAKADPPTEPSETPSSTETPTSSGRDTSDS